MRILVVEDEIKVAQFIRQGLTESSEEVDIAMDGATGLKLALENSYDLVILDWLLPGIEGIEICRSLRKSKKDLPIIMLTAKDDLDDKVLGLDTGADDYITKPFAFEELKARIRSLMRRGTGKRDLRLTFGDLEVDLADRTVRRNDEIIELSGREFALLSYFLKNRNRILSRGELAEQVWHIPFDPGTNIVDVYVNYLRKKLNPGADQPLILTVRGSGYILRDSLHEDD